MLFNCVTTNSKKQEGRRIAVRLLVLRHTSGAHFSERLSRLRVSPKSMRVEHPIEGIPDALLFFTEYLYVYKVFQLSNIKKSGLPILPHGKLWKPAPLQSRTET